MSRQSQRTRADIASSPATSSIFDTGLEACLKRTPRHRHRQQRRETLLHPPKSQLLSKYRSNQLVASGGKSARRTNDCAGSVGTARISAAHIASRGAPHLPARCRIRAPTKSGVPVCVSESIGSRFMLSSSTHGPEMRQPMPSCLPSPQVEGSGASACQQWWVWICMRTA